MDSDKLEGVKLFLKEGKNYSEISKLLDTDSRTVKKIHMRMIKLEEIEEQEKKEEVAYVPLGEYQNLLRRVKKLEGWRDNEYVNEYNNLLHYVTKTVDPHVNYLSGELGSHSKRIGMNTTNIEHLKFDFDIIKEVKKLEIAEFLEKSAKYRLDRNQAEVEADKLIVEKMAREQQKRKKTTDAARQKLKDLEDMDKKETY